MKLNRTSFIIVSFVVLTIVSCGREPSRLLRQGQLPVYDFPLYMSEGATGTIWKFDRAGTKTSFATGLINPFGIATDRYNNLYVVDRDASQLLKFNTSTGAKTVLLSGLALPSVVAVDSVGEIYVAQDTPHNVIRASDQSVIASFYNLPGAIAIGVSDLLIVGDTGTNTVYWGKTASSASAPVTSPVNIGTDQMGRVYVAEGLASNAHVWRFSQSAPGGSGTVVADKLKSPTGIAVDPVGNVYVAEKGNQRVAIVTTEGVYYSFADSITDPGYLAFTQY